MSDHATDVWFSGHTEKKKIPNSSVISSFCNAVICLFNWLFSNISIDHMDHLKHPMCEVLLGSI